MLAEVTPESLPLEWSGAYFFAEVAAPEGGRPAEVHFRAHDNGITFAVSMEEWKTMDALFRRA